MIMKRKNKNKAEQYLSQDEMNQILKMAQDEMTSSGNTTEHFDVGNKTVKVIEKSSVSADDVAVLEEAMKNNAGSPITCIMNGGRVISMSSDDKEVARAVERICGKQK